MKKISDLLRKQELFGACFVIGLVLYNWPVLSIPDRISVQAVYVYIFLTWLGVIFLLFLISSSYSRYLKNQKNSDEEASDV